MKKIYDTNNDVMDLIRPVIKIKMHKVSLSHKT